MTTVTIVWHGQGVRTRVGQIDFFGIPTDETDGEVTIPVDSDGEIVHEWYRCEPVELLARVNVIQIACALATNTLTGQVDGYEWYAS